jgi:hypothetical protein
MSRAALAPPFARAQANVRRLLRDLRRVVGGFAALLRYRFAGDVVDLGLGQLSGAGVAVAGRPNRYVVTIASTRTEPEDVTLIVDIYVADFPTHPDGHYAHFAKGLRAQPRTATRVEIEYDWRARAGFVVDGVRYSADHLWRGTLDRKTRYSVSTVLQDAHGTRVEVLTISQELEP